MAFGISQLGAPQRNGISTFADNMNPGYTSSHDMQGRTALAQGRMASDVAAAQPARASDFDYGSAGIKTTEQLQAATKEAKKQTLNQEDFLKLLTVQLQSQDPTNPADNNQLVTQMSQLSMVENLTSINENMDSVIGTVNNSSALNATSLIGTYVYTDSPNAMYNGNGTCSWAIDAGNEVYHDVKLSIKDAATGQVVYTDSAESIAGEIKFAWPGVFSPDGPIKPQPGENAAGGVTPEGDSQVAEGETVSPTPGDAESGAGGAGGDSGKPEYQMCAAGRYVLEVTGVNNAGQTVAMPSKSLAMVTSVTLGKTMEDTMLSVYGHGQMSFAQAKKVTI